jgi:predicted dehydrogenase
MTRHAPTTRRTFLKQVAAASAAALAIPEFVPATALGKDGKAAPSDRLVVGCIGTGGQGTANALRFASFKDVQVVAVCDVDAGHRKAAQGKINQKYGTKDCKAYLDFRDLLKRDDIDVVSIATPDHWHALTAVAAARAGKHIYCEKPLANSVGEGRAICAAVGKKDLVLQTGSHERSNPNVRYACELVRNGRIGKLHTVRIHLPCTDGHHKQAMALDGVPPPMKVPAGFNYNFWLGHTPRVPYTEKRCHFWWRFILAYGGGEITDRGAHIIDLAQLGAGTDDTGPVEIVARGNRKKKSLYDAFWNYDFTCAYESGVKLVGTNKPPRGLKFEGKDGWIFVHIHGGRLEASDPKILKETIGAKEIHLGRSPRGHHRNFIDCVKDRKKRLIAPAEVGHRTATICHLINIALLTGKKLKWDPKKEHILNDETAEKMLMPKMRAPWKL